MDRYSLITIKLLWAIVQRLPEVTFALVLGLRFSGYPSSSENGTAALVGSGASILKSRSSHSKGLDEVIVGLNDTVFFPDEFTHYAIERTARAPELFEYYLRQLLEINHFREVSIMLKLPVTPQGVWSLWRAVRRSRVKGVKLHIPLIVDYRHSHQLSKTYLAWHRLPLFIRRSCPVEARGSLFRHSLMLGSAGYKEISLYGIDLSNTYFWTGKVEYEKLRSLRKDLFESRAEALHPTVGESLELFLEDFEVLRRYLWTRLGVKIKKV